MHDDRATNKLDRKRLNGGNRHQDEPVTADDFVKLINATWREAIDSIIETGRLLIKAKEQLRHGEWGRLVDDKLPFSRRFAQMLMKVARHPIISNAKHASHLPRSATTLYALTQLPDRELEEMLADGRINCETQRKDVDQLNDKVEGDGLYEYHRVPEALNVLIRFIEKWQDAAAFARLVFDDMREDPHGLDDLDNMMKVPPWVTELHAACKRAEEEENARSEAENAEWEAAQRRKAEIERVKPKRALSGAQRANLAYGRALLNAKRGGDHAQD